MIYAVEDVASMTSKTVVLVTIDDSIYSWPMDIYCYGLVQH